MYMQVPAINHLMELDPTHQQVKSSEFSDYVPKYRQMDGNEFWDPFDFYEEAKGG